MQHDGKKKPSKWRPANLHRSESIPHTLIIQMNQTIMHIHRKTYEHEIVMSGGRACPTSSAKDRSMHHTFWNCSSRRIHTSTYGNLIHLKLSNQGWNRLQHKHPSPLSQHVSNRIRKVFENGMIEAHMHRSLELVRCWVKNLSTLAFAIRRLLVHDLLMEWNLTYLSGCKGNGRRSIDQV